MGLNKRQLENVDERACDEFGRGRSGDGGLYEKGETRISGRKGDSLGEYLNGARGEVQRLL